MGQLSIFKTDSKALFPTLSKMRPRQQASIKNKYDLSYMFQTYGLNMPTFLEWMLNKMQPTGNESVLDYSYVKHLISDPDKAYFNSFEKVYVLANANDSFHARVQLTNCFSEVKIKLDNNLKMGISSNSIDYIYANHCPSLLSEAEKEQVIFEFMRLLKSTGTFYLTTLSTEYYDAINDLFIEYGIERIDLSLQDIEGTMNKLNELFQDVTLETYKANLWITNVDDLISYILLEPELKSFNSVISSQGISKLRRFLTQKIQKEGGILIPYHVNVIESHCKIQLKLV